MHLLVQQLAGAAVRDGAAKEDLKMLAALGSHGQYPGNCHSELLSKLAPTYVHTAIRMMPALIKKPHAMLQQCNMPVLLPHQVFAVL